MDLCYGEDVVEGAEGCSRVPLEDRSGKLMTELLVTAPDGREMTI